MLKKNYDFNWPACSQQVFIWINCSYYFVFQAVLSFFFKTIIAKRKRRENNGWNDQLRKLQCAGNDINDQLIKDQFIMKHEQYDEWTIAHDSFRSKPSKTVKVKYACR